MLQAADLEGFGETALLAADAAPEDALRGWWSSDVARTRFNEEDLNETLAVLRDILAKDHYDVCVLLFLNGMQLSFSCTHDLWMQGVFGFSQGAVLAAMLAGLVHVHSYSVSHV